MMKTLPVAVQVYSVRDDAEKDFKGTMQKLKEMGYEGVELAGLYGLSGKEVRAILDEVGIKAISAHVPFQLLTTDLENTLNEYVEIGVDYIAIPYLSEEDRPGAAKFEENLEKMKEIGKACKEKGMTMLYHNHDFEFIKMPNGQYGLDYIYSTIGADILETEIDTCWVKVSGEDPADFLKKYTGRAPVVHLKDFYKEGKAANMYELIGTEVKKEAEAEGKFEFRPVGSGMQDFPSILAASLEAGSKWVVVEQDQTYDIPALEAVKMSREYLKTLGW
ncbi:sugar phosphate isomerase/epimerase family protein [Scatolibacter rhodanostii]|uniref:sugar phosphate isomerase/epimerase family protein n=1 Tax=Scatolibacter rhodanostii TaxID=2014781 RepID=UPI001FA91A56|nr:sugar phosphate isomerase/epimerase [Scatolibacter rhodanostii]